MLSCVYNGRSISYYDYVGNDPDSIVKNKIRIRELSDKGELYKGCGEKVILVSPEKKRKHFRHHKHSNCSYDIFSKEHSGFEDIKCYFYDIITKQPHDYSVTMDKRLPDGSWVDIAFEFNDGRMVVLNFIKRSFSDMKLCSMHSLYYDELKIPSLWIINGEPSEMNNYVTMYDKDALLMQKNWQMAAIYCNVGNPNLLLKYEMNQKIRTGQRFAYRNIPISDLDINSGFIQHFIIELIEQSNALIEIDNLNYKAELEENRKLKEKEMALKAEKRAALEKNKLKENFSRGV